MKYMKSLFCYLLFIFTVNAEELKTTENDPLKFSGNYFFYGGASADVIEGKDQGAFSGIARMTVNWMGYRDESDQDTGQLQLRLDHKHSYTDATPKDFMMSNVGGFGLIQPAFSDIGFRLTNLYWRQEFNAQDTELMVGFLDSTDYIDTYALGNPWSGFSNVQFSTGAGAIAIPDESTLGVTVKHMMSANFYTLASFSDAKADSTEPFTGIDNIINENHYFKSVEIGWIPSKEVFYVQNVHLIVWHSDGKAARPTENYGANLSAIYLTDNWMPFLRVGVSEGPENLYKSSVVMGTGYLGLGEGTLGVALGWAKPNAPVDEVMNTEFYYKADFGPLSITPNIQYLNGLPFNLNNDDAWIFGVRGVISI